MAPAEPSKHAIGPAFTAEITYGQHTHRHMTATGGFTELLALALGYCTCDPTLHYPHCVGVIILPQDCCCRHVLVRVSIPDTSIQALRGLWKVTSRRFFKVHPFSDDPGVETVDPRPVSFSLSINCIGRRADRPTCWEDGGATLGVRGPGLNSCQRQLEFILSKISITVI